MRAASMNDADASIANTPPAVRSPAASARLAIYYAFLVTEAVSPIGSQISEYAVSIAVFRATGVARCGLTASRRRSNVDPP
jgi:hypothetical protein